MPRHASRIVAIAGALIVVCPARSAGAEPILVTITSGSGGGNTSMGTAGVSLIGTDGFSLIGGGQGAVSPQCCPTPGQSRSFSINFLVEPPGGIATFRGDTFTNLGDPSSVNRASISLQSSLFTIPPVTSGTTVITAPFTFTGSFSGTPGSGISVPGTTVQATLIGSGIGTLEMLGASGLWFPREVRVQFSAPPEAVPEPGTLALLGFAIAGACGVRRRIQP